MNGVTQSSQKANALIALFELGGQSRELAPVLTKMRERGINSDIHNLAHLMWPLAKENLVTFLERKNGPRHTSALVNLSLTDLGRDRAMALLGMAVGKLPNLSGRGRSAHAIGQDGTDFRRHADVAIGGPIERIKKENPMDHVPFVVLPEEEAVKFRTSSPQAARNARHDYKQPAEGISTDEISAGSMEESAASLPQDIPVHTEPDTPTQYRESDTPREYPERKPDLQIKGQVRFDAFESDFPEIVAVLGKQARIDRYTKAAELLGDDEAEIAVALLEKVKISPLEAEIIKLLG